MLIGRVVGNVWATKKDEHLSGKKLMVIKTKKQTLVATDQIGAGNGDLVLICTGSTARMVSNSTSDAAIVGIVDSLETNNFNEDELI